jgi:hypothetical protein
VAADAESAEAKKSCSLPKVRQLQVPKAHKVAMLQEMHAARHAMSGSHAMTILDHASCANELPYASARADKCTSAAMPLTRFRQICLASQPDSSTGCLPTRRQPAT